MHSVDTLKRASNLFFLTELGLPCCMGGLSLLAESRGYSRVAACGASVVAVHGLCSCDSWA